MLRLVLRDLGPVEEVLNRQALSLDLELGKASNDVPRKVNRILLDVRESICWLNARKANHSITIFPSDRQCKYRDARLSKQFRFGEKRERKVSGDEAETVWGLMMVRR